MDGIMKALDGKKSYLGLLVLILLHLNGDVAEGMPDRFIALSDTATSYVSAFASMVISAVRVSELTKVTLLIRMPTPKLTVAPGW